MMVILVQADLDTAMPVAERIRTAIAATGIVHGDSTIHLTASIGVATLLPGERPQGLIARADAALYRAKRAGRNAVELAEA
jgi:diguanylate cyclase (GGDEF)-like protein